MKPPIAAIQTRYAGCHFRSRLEARWAVFFDTLGIRWEYEPQGFSLGRSGAYLPDFWLVDHECWLEVKGRSPEWDGPDYAKARALRDKTEAPVILAAGQIGDQAHWFFAHDLGDSSGGSWESACLWTRIRGGMVELAVDTRSSKEFYADAMFSKPLAWAYGGELECAPDVWDAYKAARSARFEFGETPNGAKP